MDIILLVILLCMSAFFSASETAVTAFNRYRIKASSRKSPAAKKLVHIAKNPAEILAVVLFGNTFANLAASSIMTMLAIEVWGEIGSLYATIILTVVVLILCELTPKMIAAVYADTFALYVVNILDLISRIFSPLIRVLKAVSSVIVRMCGLKTVRGKDGFNSEELRSMVHLSKKEISEDSRDMLVGVLDIDRLTVNEVMQPIHEISGIGLDEHRDTVMKRLQQADRVYWFIYKSKVDEPLGVVHVASLMQAYSHNGRLSLDKVKVYMHPVDYVLERTNLRAQLKRFMKEGQKLDLVVDEYGEIIGSISLSDIVEEVVGHIGQHDVQASSVKGMGDGSYWVYAGLNIRTLNRSMDWSLPDEGPVTLSGLIIDRLEAIPHGPVSLIINGYRIEVMSIMHNQVKQCRIYPPKDDDSDVGAHSESE